MNNAKDYYNIHSVEYVDKWDLSPRGLDKPANYYRLGLTQSMLDLASIKQGEKVVEIGCGTGLVLREVLKVTKPIYGTDISSAMLERVKDSTLKNDKVLIVNDFSIVANSQEEVDVFLTQMDLLELNLPTNYFDKILSMEVLRYIDDLPKCLSNIRAVMKDDSSFVFTITNLYSFSLFPLKYSLRKMFGKLDKKNELLHHFVTEGSIRKDLREAGFVITDFKKINFLALNPFVESVVNDRLKAEKVKHWDAMLSKVPIVNRFFDTFIIAVKLKK